MVKNVNFSKLSVGDVFTVVYMAGDGINKHPNYTAKNIIHGHVQLVKVRRGNKIGAMLRSDYRNLTANLKNFITGDYFVFADCSHWVCDKVEETAKTATPTTDDDYYPEPRKPIDRKDNDSYILFDREESEFYRISEDVTRFIEFMNSRSNFFEDCFNDRFEIIGKSIDIKEI